MKSKLFLTAGIVVGVSISLGSIANAQFAPSQPAQGGTGTSTAPTYGQLLVGNSSGTYTLTATSSLGISSGSGGSGTVSTSTVPTVGNLAYWTSNAFPSLLGSVATTSLTASSPLSLSQPISVIGSSASALSLDTSGTWSGNAGTVTNGVYTTDTGTVTNTMLAGSIAASKLSLTKGYFIIGNDAGVAQATSTIFISSTGNVGIGTTSPGTLLSIGGTATGWNFRDGTTATSTGSGNLHIKGNLQVDGKFFAPVTLVSSGNATINGDFAVTGQTTLATSLTGLLKGTSGVVSVASAGTDYENPLTFTYPLTRATNAISLAFGTTTSNTWAGTQTFTNAPVLTSLATAAGTFLAVNGSGTIIATTTPAGGVGTGTTGQFPYYAANGTTLTATSTLSIATNGTLTIDNGLAGDASTQYGKSGYEWILGYDVTDNSFAIASSTVLGTNNALTIDKNLLVTVPTSLKIASLAGLFAGNSGNVYATATSSLAVGVSLSNSGTLGSQIGGTASSLSLNMANANTWTALQTFANASSTQFSAATETFYINSAGRVVGKNTTTGDMGAITPTKYHTFNIATSTGTWTATSTPGVDISPERTMRYAGTLKRVSCEINTFLGIRIEINGTPVAPSYFVASTTNGVITFTSANTFSVGSVITTSAGTTTSATASSGVVRGSCTIDATET